MFNSPWMFFCPGSGARWLLYISCSHDVRSAPSHIGTQALTMCINHELPYNECTYVPGDPPLLRMPLLLGVSPKGISPLLERCDEFFWNSHHMNHQHESKFLTICLPCVPNSSKRKTLACGENQPRREVFPLIDVLSCLFEASRAFVCSHAVSLFAL